MTNSKLRELVTRFVFEKFGLRLSQRVSVLNEAYPHTFNPSMDGNSLKALNSNSALDVKEFVKYAAIQPVVRTADLSNIRTSHKNYLTCFDMLGIVEFSHVPQPYDAISRSTINETHDFLIDYVGMETPRLLATVFKGGALAEITDQRIRSPRYVNRDVCSLNTWKGLGLREDQIEETASLDTFLIYFGGMEHYSGYRNEIFLKTNNEKSEVATIEFLQNKSIVDEEGRVVDIVDLNHYVRAAFFGIERLLQVINRFSSIFQCDHIFPLLNEVRKGASDDATAYLLTDALRALHIIVTDGGTFEALRGRTNSQRRAKLNDYLRVVADSGSDIKSLDAYLTLNAELQPWYPDLRLSNESVIAEIVSYQTRRK